jgi:glycoside/pentoside/hexuronide:cation symporter, GPH family
MTGFEASLGEQPEEILQRIKWLYIGLPLLLWSVSFLFIGTYPLNRTKMSDIRKELEDRRGAA